MDEVLPEARRLVGDGSPTGIKHYLDAIAAVLCQVDPQRMPRPASFSPFPGFGSETGFALTQSGSPFVAVQFKIKPSGLLPYHPHPGGSVCTLLLEGSAHVRNFEFEKEPDWEAKGKVLLRCPLLRLGALRAGNLR
jgi:hypothetical protein